MSIVSEAVSLPPAKPKRRRPLRVDKHWIEVRVDGKTLVRATVGLLRYSAVLQGRSVTPGETVIDISGGFNR